MSLSSKLITALTVIILVVILIGIYATYSAFTKTFLEVEVVFGLFLKTLMIVLCIAVFTAFLLGVWLAIEEIRNRKQKRLRFAPSERGYYEALLLDGEFIKPEHNLPLEVPRTYSPRIEITGELQKQLPSVGDINVPKPVMPSLETIIDELTPNALEFVYGLDPETGELIKTTLPKAVHMQLIGATTMGKSHEAGAILTQLAAKNDPSRLQLALIDHEGETTVPFQHLPHTKYIASDPRQAARILRELTRELERRDITKEHSPVILVFVEEFLNLRRIMPRELSEQVLEDFTTIALRGAKRGIYLFAIGHTAYSQKHIRDAQLQFLSLLAFAIKPSAARSAGFTNTPLLNQLYNEKKSGQFLLERPQGDALLLAPHINFEKIPELVCEQSNYYQDTEPLEVESSGKADGNLTGKLNEEALQAVCRLLQQGITTKGEILLAVWGVKPGRKADRYEAAEQEYKEIMQYLASLHQS